MPRSLTFEGAKQLVQKRLAAWNTAENEFFLSHVEPFTHGWVFCYDLRVGGTRTGLLGNAPFAVFQTGEVCRIPMAASSGVTSELLSRDWEAMHTPGHVAEMSEAAREVFNRLFNSLLSRLLRGGAREVQLLASAAGVRIRPRDGEEWHEHEGDARFAGALIARRLKELADVDPAADNTEGAMQSGHVTILAGDDRYSVSLCAFPTAHGEQIVLIIEPQGVAGA